MEADLVLSEVTAKKTEAKRFINLFNTLIKLRSARVQQLKSSGNFVSQSEIKSFTQVIGIYLLLIKTSFSFFIICNFIFKNSTQINYFADKLKKLWIDQLKEYNIEEQGLRVMLNDAEVERVNVEAKVTKQIHKKWNELFFGVGANKQFIWPNSLEELIAVR